MLSFSEQVSALALDMAWSLWAELGISGWTRSHPWQAIDLEPLVLFTSSICDLDARLRDESLEWCVSNGRLTSSARLRNLTKQADERVRVLFGRYAATVAEETRLPWPASGTPLPWSRRPHSQAPDLGRPALIQLRLRALVGVSARAEVLRLLLAQPTSEQSAAELAVGAAYGKIAVAQALDTLVAGGLVEAQVRGNQHQYRLSRPAELVALIGGTPSTFPDWIAIFAVARRILDFAESPAQEPLARAASIRRLLREINANLSRLGMADSLPSATDITLNQDFDSWALGLLHKWAGTAELTDVAADATYVVHRLATGDWVATVSDAQGRPTAIELPEWADIYEEHPRSDTVIADDSVGAPRLAHALFEDSHRRAGTDIEPFWSLEPDNQLIARAFAEERLWPMRPGQSAPFTADFMRSWYADRRQRLGLVGNRTAGE
jgi:DNA-binding transcriptional ArsR family regulator